MSILELRDVNRTLAQLNFSIKYGNMEKKKNDGNKMTIKSWKWREKRCSTVQTDQKKRNLVLSHSYNFNYFDLKRANLLTFIKFFASSTFIFELSKEILERIVVPIYRADSAKVPVQAYKRRLPRPTVSPA